MSSGIFYQLIIEFIGVDKLFISFYILNFIFSIIAYKFGFARKLPIGKSIIIYLLMLVGVFVITIFSMFGMPITESLIIISIVMGFYRLRLHRERQARQER